MWRQLRRYELADDRQIPVEVDMRESAGDRTAYADGEAIRLDEKLTPALALIRPVARDVIEGLERLTPDEIQVQFGINVHGEAGALIAKAGVESHLVVTVTWKR
jgi:Trypsin-co-occurring domain 1